MKKSDLQNGMILVSKKGSVSMFLATPSQNLLITVGSEVGGRLTIMDLDDNLDSQSNDEFSIEKVYNKVDLGGIAIKELSNHLQSHDLIWEREKPLKLVEFDMDQFGYAPSSVAQSYAGFDMDYSRFREEKQYIRIDFMDQVAAGNEDSIRNSIKQRLQDVMNENLQAEFSQLKFETYTDSMQFTTGMGVQYWDEDLGMISVRILSNSDKIHKLNEKSEN